MDSYGLLWNPANFLWIPMDSYGLLWTLMDSYGIPMDSHGFLWILMIPMELLWIPIDS